MRNHKQNLISEYPFIIGVTIFIKGILVLLALAAVSRDANGQHHWVLHVFHVLSFFELSMGLFLIKTYWPERGQ